MWPLSTEPRPVRPPDTTSGGQTAHPGVVGCRFRPQGASAVGVHKASLTPPLLLRRRSRPKERALFESQLNERRGVRSAVSHVFQLTRAHSTLPAYHGSRGCVSRE